jgi:hypothetical protein
MTAVPRIGYGLRLSSGFEGYAQFFGELKDPAFVAVDFVRQHYHLLVVCVGLCA